MEIKKKKERKRNKRLTNVFYLLKWYGLQNKVNKQGEWT